MCKQQVRAGTLLEFSLSMRSGAIGLTLTAADHCLIMDIAQNTVIEEQAINIIHRFRQLRPATINRFVMQETVEERLLGVRRPLGGQRTGTQICGASVLVKEEQATQRPSKKARG